MSGELSLWELQAADRDRQKVIDKLMRTGAAIERLRRVQQELEAGNVEYACDLDQQVGELLAYDPEYEEAIDRLCRQQQREGTCGKLGST